MIMIKRKGMERTNHYDNEDRKKLMQMIKGKGKN